MIFFLKGFSFFFRWAFLQGHLICSNDLLFLAVRKGLSAGYSN